MPLILVHYSMHVQFNLRGVTLLETFKILQDFLFPSHLFFNKKHGRIQNLANLKLVQIVAILFLYSSSAHGRISMLI